MAILNPYIGTFAQCLVGAEATEQTAASLTPGNNTIPIFKDTLSIDLGLKQEYPELEDMYGTAYQGQVVQAACTWGFESPIYGVGKTTYVNIPKLWKEVIRTCCDLVQATNSLEAFPTINHPQQTDGASVVSSSPVSFTMAGYFGMKGRVESSSGANYKLKGTLVGCKVGKMTFSFPANSFARVKFEGQGIYTSAWSDAQIDLSGDLWDVESNAFIRGLSTGTEAGGVALNTDGTEIAIDFGLTAVESDNALSALGIGTYAPTKREISVTTNPIWLPSATQPFFATSLAGGTFQLTSTTSYPSAYAATVGRGFSFEALTCQFANSKPDRKGAVRQPWSGMAIKSTTSQFPFSFTVG